MHILFAFCIRFGCFLDIPLHFANILKPLQTVIVTIKSFKLIGLSMLHDILGYFIDIVKVGITYAVIDS